MLETQQAKKEIMLENQRILENIRLERETLSPGTLSDSEDEGKKGMAKFGRANKTHGVKSFPHN